MLRAVVFLVITARLAAAQPTGKHPRILLDDPLRAAWKDQAKKSDSPVGRAMSRCEAARSGSREYTHDSYMGFDWQASLSACLIAWVARGNDADAKTAVTYVSALLDDLEDVGDKKGGEAAVRRDTGYAIRSMPPFVALAYDWLYDHPAMTAGIKQKIRERSEQWVGWYRKGGYHNHTPATNYHAGYIYAATLVAVALAGDGEFATSLWPHVRDDLWGRDMAKALAQGGILDGGDFPEGWQYAPLSVAEYALSARVAQGAGIKIDGVDKWLAAMFVRTMHARSGSRDTIAAVGDTEEKQPSIAVHPLTLLAIMVGPAPEVIQRQAAAEKQRLGLVAKDNFLFEALAAARNLAPAVPVVDKWPTSYYAPGVRTFYARTSWAADGVWMYTICTPSPNVDADHLQPAAGNLLVTRGKDEVIVDPSPYASWSSLTGNAPTVESKQLPPKYRPSQALWSESTHFVWALQTASGVVATRCDYADQYKFQERSSDISTALRDFVLVPWGKSKNDASIVVIDRAETAGTEQQMHLRFRSPGGFSKQGDAAVAKVGGSTLAIRRVPAADGELRVPKVGDCYSSDKGKCDTTRFTVGEYRVQIPGPTPEAVHVLDVSGGDALAVDAAAAGVVHMKRGSQDAYVATKAASFRAAPGATVVASIEGGKIAATKDGAACKVDVTDGGTDKAATVVILDAACKATDDARTGPAAPNLDGSSSGALIPVGGPPKAKSRGGCCGASSGSSSSVLGLFVLAGLVRRRPLPSRG